MADKAPGAIAIAECDLGSSACDSTKRPIHRRYDQIRRADSFRVQRAHLWG